MTDISNGNLGEDAVQPPLLIIAEESEEDAVSPVALPVSPEAPTLIEVLEPEAQPEAAPVADAPTQIPPLPTILAIEPEAEIAPPPPAAPPVPEIAVEQVAAPEPEPVAAPPKAPSAPRASKKQAPAPIPLRQEAAVVTEEDVIPPKARKQSRLRFVPLAAVSLAVFASSISAIGILIASHMVARTNVVLEQVEAHQSKLRRLDAMIDEIDALRKHEQVAVVRLEQINAGRPATGAEVRSALGGLQLMMAKYQPGGSNASISMLRDGQAELAERVSTTYMRIGRIDEKLDKLIAARATTPSPKAPRAAGRAPTS